MQIIDTDVCVIGAGSGGLSVASGAAQLGARVVLIEAHKMGGDCLNYGCVPSKALLAFAARVKGQPASDDSFRAAMDHVASVIATIAPADSQERFEGLGVTVLRERGIFRSPTEVVAGDRLVRARRFVIATGSSPLVPPISGLENVSYLTNETIFDLRIQPRHLMIIGCGPIGLEMAQAHRRLGGEVTLIEAARALSKDDPDAAALVIASLRSEGVQIFENSPAVRVSETGQGVEVELKTGRTIAGSHLLVAVGRKPNLDIGLNSAGIATEAGALQVDARLRTTNRRVYAIGDVAGGLQFTHVAGYHAGIVIRQILLGLPAKVAKRHIPRATYTDPELAQIGQTEAEARKAHGHRLTVVQVPLQENDRAVASGRVLGMLKLMVVRGRPVGVTIVGAQAGEMIGLWALAMASNLKLSAISATILPYPTLNDLSKRAAGAYFSPKLFDNPVLKRFVWFVQRMLP